LSAPSSAPSPTARPIATTAGAEGCDDTYSPVRYAVTPTIEPTDRSMLRVTITVVWATASTAVMATLVVTRLKNWPL
jgi:hypothetical protein